MLWLALAMQFVVSNFNDLFTNYYFSNVMWWMFLGLIANLVWPYTRSTKEAEGRVYVSESRAIEGMARS
jgi:heme/copper-type cytochrome/quinol oxidase subunit 2